MAVRKGIVKKPLLMIRRVKIGDWDWACPALENRDLVVIDGKLSINDMLDTGWSLVRVEIEGSDIHKKPLKSAKKTTSKSDLTDSDKFGYWFGVFTKPYTPRK